MDVECPSLCLRFSVAVRWERRSGRIADGFGVCCSPVGLLLRTFLPVLGAGLAEPLIGLSGDMSTRRRGLNLHLGCLLRPAFHAVCGMWCWYSSKKRLCFHPRQTRTDPPVADTGCEGPGLKTSKSVTC